MKHRPSSLPALAQCPRFESNPDAGEFAEAGTARHAMFAKHLKAGTNPDQSEQAAEAVTEALEWARLVLPSSEYPLRIEEKMEWTAPDFTVRTGTPDVLCGLTIFDLKSRPRDYKAQMADYAMCAFEQYSPFGEGVVTAYLFFTETRTRQTYQFTAQEAWDLVEFVLKLAEEPLAAPRACSYCGWCKHQLTCPAVVESVNAVVSNRPDMGLETWHSSEIGTPEQMGRALRIARSVGKWADAVEWAAKKMAQDGQVPDGFKVQTRRGNREITDATVAYQRSALDAETFMRCCKVSFKELADAVKDKEQIPAKAAEKTMEARLGDVLTRKSDTVSLFEQ